jgi:hypothetical protein
VNLEDFKLHIAERIEASIRNCERQLEHELPRKLAFYWMSPKGPTVTAGIEDEVARVAFEGEDKIWPCIDIGPFDLDDDGTLIIGAIRAGYPPKPFGENWRGELGPFILVYSDQLARKLA